MSDIYHPMLDGPAEPIGLAMPKDEGRQTMNGKPVFDVRAKRHPNFKGGVILASHGYRLLYVGKTHHLADCRGYAYEHRVVMEGMLGRRLRAEEVVHHKNGVKHDNRTDNLELKSCNAEHLRSHGDPNSKRRQHGEPNLTTSCECGCGKRFPRFDSSHRPRRFINGHGRKRKNIGAVLL